MLRMFSFVAVPLLLLANHASANDTMAELKTGGVIYSQSGDIEMASEALSISLTDIGVRYVFHNKADHDVTSLIAFPMPDIEGGPEAEEGINVADTDNFLDFSVKQDGKPITPLLNQRAVALGIDQSDLLRRFKIPFLPLAVETSKAMEALPKADQDELVTRGLALTETFDDGTGSRAHMTPLWTLKSAYTWTTTFPAGQNVTVEHHYTPSVGMTFAVSDPGDENSSYRKDFCADEAFTKAAKDFAKGMENGASGFSEHWVSYVLSTGANWSGPIGTFTLTIDKGDPANLASTCMEGLTAKSPTVLEVTKTDFEPRGDLRIVFLMPLKG